MSTDPLFERLKASNQRLDTLDAMIASRMQRWGVPVLRVAVAVVFIWFGALKIVDMSPADDLIAATIYLVSPELFIPILGVWEVLIGVCLLYRPLTRLGIFLLFLQLPGTFLPIIILPEAIFTTVPYGLTVEGQYIIKNLVIIGAALVIGGSARDE